MIKQTSLKSTKGELFSFLEESDWGPYINNYVRFESNFYNSLIYL